MSGIEDRRKFSIDGKEPETVAYPVSSGEISQLLKEANEQGRAVSAVGHGAFLHLGAVPKRYDLALSTRALNHIIDYHPLDMTVRVEAGMTLAELQATLGENGQWLPLDPPLPEQATIGGIIAANLSGPSRLSQGMVRDFLIGLRVVRSDGTLFKGGGQVVKNVAGYDLPKLYCGSLGTLGIIVEATFMVRPRPEVQTTLAFTFPSAEKAGEAALKITGSDLQSFFLELANFSHSTLSTSPPDREGQGEKEKKYRLFLCFAGIREEVDDQSARVRDIIGEGEYQVEELGEEAARALSQILRDFPVSGKAALRCKVSLLPTQLATFCADLDVEAQRRQVPGRLLARAGNGVLYCAFDGEAVADEQLLALVDWIRVHATRNNGFAVVEAIAPALKERADVWGHVGKAFPLMRKLKETLDPNGILNPGRFVGGI